MSLPKDPDQPPPIIVYYEVCRFCMKTPTIYRDGFCRACYLKVHRTEIEAGRDSFIEFWKRRKLASTPPVDIHYSYPIGSPIIKISWRTEDQQNNIIIDPRLLEKIEIIKEIMTEITRTLIETFEPIIKKMIRSMRKFRKTIRDMNFGKLDDGLP